MERDDEQLIYEYLEGNDNSLDFLIERYLKDVYNFAFKLTNNLQMAEDVTQESFVKAWKHIRKFRQGANFKSWIFSITRNTAIDWLRKKNDVPFSFFENDLGENRFVEAIVDEELMPDELIARAEDTIFAQSLLDQLSLDYQEVLTLRYTSKLTFEEIGEILRKPIHTVKSQHRRALIALKRSLQVKTI